MQIGRKDKVRNRAELLSAAEAAVAAHGVNVHFGIIADAASVGRATLYRHFPDRSALLEALLHRSIDLLEEVSSRHRDDDALFQVLQHHADHVERYAAVGAHWRLAQPEDAGLKAARQRFNDIMSPLLQRAIKAGLCHEDVTLLDIRSIFVMLSSLSPEGAGGAKLAHPRRMLDWLIEGLTPP